MTDPKALATVRDYGGLVTAMRARKDELRLSDDELDELANVPRGTANKYLGPSQNRVLGPVSMGVYLDALGLQLFASPRPGYAEWLRTQYQYEPRDEKRRRTGLRKQLSDEAREKIAKELAQEWGRQGAAAVTRKARSDGRRKIPRWKRRAIARQAGRARARKAAQRQGLEADTHRSVQ